ncbi:MAG: hypothetical protein GKS05_07990 [Nitrospirales bacterium]|nr:hypothetical protein [Nitrospirales bacterium]
MITITLMGELETTDGERTLACEIEHPIPVKQLIQQQGRTLRPVFRLLREHKIMVMVNKRIASEDTQIYDGDLVNLLAHDGMSSKGLGPSLY